MFVRPDDVSQALELRKQGGWSILAGGTDFYPALRGKPLPQGKILDISGLDTLKNISCDDEYWRLGACVTWRMISDAAQLPQGFDVLKMAAREVGSIQIQNSATIAGNLCTASPAGDGIAALSALQAQVELRSCEGERTVPLSEFIDGYRSTMLQSDEIVTAVLVSRKMGDGISSFFKLGARRYLVISIAMAAVHLIVDDTSVIAESSIALGACSAVAQRIPLLEQRLCGQSIDAVSAEMVKPEDFAHLTPLDDVRSTAQYRRHAACEITARALQDCLSKAGRRA